MKGIFQGMDSSIRSGTDLKIFPSILVCVSITITPTKQVIQGFSDPTFHRPISSDIGRRRHCRRRCCSVAGLPGHSNETIFMMTSLICDTQKRSSMILNGEGVSTKPIESTKRGHFVVVLVGHLSRSEGFSAAAPCHDGRLKSRIAEWSGIEWSSIYLCFPPVMVSRDVRWNGLDWNAGGWNVEPLCIMDGRPKFEKEGKSTYGGGLEISLLNQMNR